MTTPSAAVIAKAHKYLAEGRVKVREVTRGNPTCLIDVTGSADEPYLVWASDGEFHCSCPSRLPVCAHIAASMLITNMEAKPNG